MRAFGQETIILLQGGLSKIMRDLKNYLFSDAILELLALCIFGDDGKVKRALNEYKTSNDHLLFGAFRDSELIGLIGIVLKPDHAEIKHIAVKSDYRYSGVGKSMIHMYLQESNVERLIAETDIDAVNFYRQIGFSVSSIGEKYPGRERFQCILAKQ
jgi:ribosomal protein S18 acetylase RimI-like enzyme